MPSATSAEKKAKQIQESGECDKQDGEIDFIDVEVLQDHGIVSVYLN